MKNVIKNKKHREFRSLVSNNVKALLKAGFTYSAISRWASGQRVPSSGSAKRIATAINVPIDKIPYRVEMII